LSPALAERLLRRNRDGGRLLNLYGPSETIAATMHEVGAADLLRARIPVGRPLAGRDVLVLSDEGKPVPLNQCGEIWIHSLDMADGYAFSPASEQQRFAALPDRASGQAGRYRTGDLGRWLSDGVLDIVGRRDTQVKLNGVRIELEAIEATLMAAPGVRACIAALV
ncbi:AMP-binding protein, partial [Rugamonas sp. FT82W]